MSTVLTEDELEIFDEIGRLAGSLWEASKQVTGRFTDPRLMSCSLFKRLWTNHLGFTLLWKHPLPLEATMVLRSGLEAAICIAANARLGDAFVTLVRADAAATLVGQIKMHRSDGATDLVKNGEANLRFLAAGLPEGTKVAKLDWQSLATDGEVPRLYGFHRMLSGTSSHVTGLSLMEGLSDDTGEMDASQAKLRKLNEKMRPMMMASATLTGSLLHAGVIGDDAHYKAAEVLVRRMNKISEGWPGVQ